MSRIEGYGLRRLQMPKCVRYAALGEDGESGRHENALQRRRVLRQELAPVPFYSHNKPARLNKRGESATM